MNGQIVFLDYWGRGEIRIKGGNRIPFEKAATIGMDFASSIGTHVDFAVLHVDGKAPRAVGVRPVTANRKD
jgi:hypothetical protein